LVLRLYQETVYDFILLFMPPCGPHLTSLATGSLERSLLVFSTLGGFTGDDISRLFFTCTNPNQAATCTCNT
jgi:ubiquitin